MKGDRAVATNDEQTEYVRHAVALPDAAPSVAQMQSGRDRVLLADTSDLSDYRKQLDKRGIQYRVVPGLLTQATLRVTHDRDSVEGQFSFHIHDHESPTQWKRINLGPYHSAELLRAERDGFDRCWDDHTPSVEPEPEPTPVAQLVPAHWEELLPYPMFNPAQAQAIPEIMKDRRHLVVCAPTGAGKTVMGMIAFMAELRRQGGGRTVWLVPQRSLTDELDVTFESWRTQGVRVERLSGEHAMDIDRVNAADLWVITTEKFESMCRASSTREAISNIGTVIVDEIHLLGDQTRGPVLEALLARLRALDTSDTDVRVIGLSATIANAEQVAEWLGAKLISLTWRPTTLTTQLVPFEAHADWDVNAQRRTQLTVHLVARHVKDNGSVLVFCGTKKSVRVSALADAASRGARTTGIHLDDTEAIAKVCGAVGIGLHYSDWPYRRESEQQFRKRRINTLYATSTLAAGVNLPARTVIVRDTSIGRQPMEVSMIQQMFGRAGRAGHEPEGWAYLLCDHTEYADWKVDLAEGYRAQSALQDALADHLLAEIVQQRVVTNRQAEAWWVETLAYHQGAHDLAPLSDALDLLAQTEMVTIRELDDRDAGVRATPLGELTSRMMVPVEDAAFLRSALLRTGTPADEDQAEDLLITLLANNISTFQDSRVSDDAVEVVGRILARGGRLTSQPGKPDTRYRRGLAASSARGSDLTRAVLLLIARSPRLFTQTGRTIAGLARGLMWPILAEAPRYLAWLGGQGYIRTIPPWIAIVAADLGRRVKWHKLGPPRGAGRLLGALEQLAGPAEADRRVPALWSAARSRHLTSPDWPAGPTPPRGSIMTSAAYQRWCSGRAHLQAPAHDIPAAGTRALTVRATAGATVAVQPAQGVAWPSVSWESTDHTGVAKCAVPALDASASNGAHIAGSEPIVAVFTRAGDHIGTRWLSAYQTVNDSA